MKKNELEKIGNEINEDLKKVLDNINKLVQKAKRSNWTLTDTYSRISSAMSELQSLIESELNHNREVDMVFGFNNSLFDFKDDDGGDK